MKIITCLPIVFFLTAHAQNNSLQPARGLNIGDTVPDISFVIQNYSKPTANFSDFKNKAVILDFWFGACHGCIDAFPKMEALQEKFKDKLQIIMVNFESQRTIDSTFSKRRRSSTAYRNPMLPSVVSDTIFHQLFSFQYYPHLVWIDASGVVRAFTDSHEATEKNIRLLAEKGLVQMDMKLDDLRFDRTTSLLPQVFRYFPSHVKYYATILSYIDGVRQVGFSYLIDSATSSVRILKRNSSILDLIGSAVTNGVDGDPFQSVYFDYGKRVDLRITDSARWFFQEQKGLSRQQWERENCYSYESVLPLQARPALYRQMLADLEKFFKVNCYIEKIQMQCLALVRTSDRDKIKSKDGRALRVDDPRIVPDKLQLYGSKTEWLVNAISRANKNSPFVFADDTGYKDRINIEIDKNAVGDIPALRKQLAKYDLDLVIKTLPMDVLVIIDKAPPKGLE